MQTKNNNQQTNKYKHMNNRCLMLVIFIIYLFSMDRVNAQTRKQICLNDGWRFNKETFCVQNELILTIMIGKLFKFLMTGVLKVYLI